MHEIVSLISRDAEEGETNVGETDVTLYPLNRSREEEIIL